MSADGEGWLLAEDFAVRKFIRKFGESGVAGVVLFDVGDDQFAHLWQQGAIDFGAADDVGGAFSCYCAGDLGGIVDHGDSGMGPVAIAGEDDVLSLGQRATDRIEGFAAHDDGVTAGGFFEKGKILGQVPR